MPSLAHVSHENVDAEIWVAIRAERRFWGNAGWASAGPAFGDWKTARSPTFRFTRIERRQHAAVEREESVVYDAQSPMARIANFDFSSLDTMTASRRVRSRGTRIIQINSDDVKLRLDLDCWIGPRITMGFLKQNSLWDR